MKKLDGIFDGISVGTRHKFVGVFIEDLSEIPRKSHLICCSTLCLRSPEKPNFSALYRLSESSSGKKLVGESHLYNKNIEKHSENGKHESGSYLRRCENGVASNYFKTPSEKEQRSFVRSFFRLCHQV